MKANERALLLKNKYRKEYLRDIIKGYLKQKMTEEEKKHWQEVAIELGKLYKNK